MAAFLGVALGIHILRNDAGRNLGFQAVGNSTSNVQVLRMGLGLAFPGRVPSDSRFRMRTVAVNMESPKYGNDT